MQKFAIAPEAAALGIGATVDLSLNELMVAFWRHVVAHYRRPDGSATSEVNSFKVSLRPL